MLQLGRLRAGKDSPWDLGFYHHEKSEAEICRPYLGMSNKEYLERQEKAHRETERNQQDTWRQRYHPDVISRYPELFR
jgi:hypothetical protein